MKIYLNKSFFLNLFLAIVLLFQGKFYIPNEIRNIPKNFANINFVKCNNPDHSHPPLSEPKKTITIEKIYESGNKLYYLFAEKYKCYEVFYVSHQNSIESIPKFLSYHYRPIRAPPFNVV